jgi:myo-inositol-1(or 4)-monophosphatase
METLKESELLDTAVRGAELAGRLIIENLGRLTGEDIGSKQASDFVTRVDTDSERLIIKTIKERFPDHHILSEESLKDAGTGWYRWIIDPLDGTTNYIHQYPMFSVSIALQHEGKVVLGVVYDPLREELFTALKGHGAFLNEGPIRTSSGISPEAALITTGFPFREKEKLDVYLRAFRRIFLMVSGIRRAGSAALDLAHLAAGRCDGFFELGLKPWDIAAGSLLIGEAGGIVTDFGGGPDYLLTGNVVAGGPGMHGEILREVKAVFGGTIDA